MQIVKYLSMSILDRGPSTCRGWPISVQRSKNRQPGITEAGEQQQWSGKWSRGGGPRLAIVSLKDLEDRRTKTSSRSGRPLFAGCFRVSI